MDQLLVFGVIFKTSHFSYCHLFCPYRFLESKEETDKVRKCFAGLWSLDDEEIIKTAVEKPELFVLKPQREGGGLYSIDICISFLTVS